MALKYTAWQGRTKLPTQLQLVLRRRAAPLYDTDSVRNGKATVVVCGGEVSLL